MSDFHLDKFKKYVDLEKLIPVIKQRNQALNASSFEQYHQAIAQLDDIDFQNIHIDLSKDWIELGKADDINENEKQLIISAAQTLIPWRKGPFKLFGESLDAEWRSDYKWNRLKSYLGNLKGKKILDIGCNNGYFLFKMAQQNPSYLLGIDPFALYYFQFKLLQKISSIKNTHFELFGVEHLIHFNQMFDVVFSMGIIYHQRHPLQQLINIRDALKPGGQLILETIGIAGEQSYALFPEDRYAQMRNVYFVPTLSCLINWAKKAKFVEIEVVCDTLLTPEEQRNTSWCPAPFKTLEDFLDVNDPSKTIEGHPAPRRFCISMKKRKINQKLDEVATATIVQ